MTDIIAVVVGVATFFSLTGLIGSWGALGAGLFACSLTYTITGFVSAWLRDIQR